MVFRKRFSIGALAIRGVLLVGIALAVGASSACVSSGDFEEAKKRSEERWKKMTGETVGTVTEYKESRGTGTRTDKSITFEYEVNGTKYTHTHSVNDGHRFGKGVKGQVCYDPSNPGDGGSFSLDKGRKCGG